MKKLPGWIIFCVLACICKKIEAQNILSLSPGASAGSYGSIRSIHQDVLAMYGNEAGLAYIEGTALYASAEKRFGVEGLNFYSLAGIFPTRLGNFGGTIQYHGFDQFNEQLIGLAYGRKLVEYLAVGAQFDYVQVRIPGYGRTSTFTAEVGMQSWIGQQVVIGFHVYNPFEIKWVDQETLPSIFTLGIAYVPTTKVRVMAEVEKVSELVENVKFGLEYQLIKELAVRVGFNTNPSLVTFGVGYHLEAGFDFDVGSGVHQELGFTPLGGVGYQFQKDQR